MLFHHLFAVQKVVKREVDMKKKQYSNGHSGGGVVAGVQVARAQAVARTNPTTPPFSGA
jgi:hypothetical protein